MRRAPTAGPRHRRTRSRWRSPTIKLVQRGGAERAALLLADAFPGAPMYTSLYDAARTFPEFALLDVRTSPLDRVVWFRGHVRAALPFMKPGRFRVAPLPRRR